MGAGASSSSSSSSSLPPRHVDSERGGSSITIKMANNINSDDEDQYNDMHDSFMSAVNSEPTKKSKVRRTNQEIQNNKRKALKKQQQNKKLEANNGGGSVEGEGIANSASSSSLNSAGDDGVSSSVKPFKESEKSDDVSCAAPLDKSTRSAITGDSYDLENNRSRVASGDDISLPAGTGRLFPSASLQLIIDSVKHALGIKSRKKQSGVASNKQILKVSKAVEMSFLSEEKIAIVEHSSPFFLAYVNAAWERHFGAMLEEVVDRPLMFCITERVDADETRRFYSLFDDIDTINDHTCIRYDGMIAKNSSSGRSCNYTMSCQYVEDDEDIASEDKKTYIMITFFNETTEGEEAAEEAGKGEGGVGNQQQLPLPAAAVEGTAAIAPQHDDQRVCTADVSGMCAIEY